MLTFVEETCLLLLDEKSGELLPIHPNILECALVGAVLVDLAFAYRIDTDPKTLTVNDRTPTGEAILDRILARIVDHPETTDTSTWIKMLSADEAAGLQTEVLDRLVERGILERREKKTLLGRRSRRYGTTDGEAAREVKQRIRALILSDEIPDPRDVALLSLLDACNVLPDIFPGGEVKNAGARIKQLRNMDLLGRDVVGAVAEIERVIVTARAHGAY
ncbi:MAG: GPP34 family phosphoprotein [Chloroflexota bacterium]|nr:GPP34 family phosphoprotein [Chloroflexota bacterium]